ncbi:hypothetical protein GYMLUDRAFT_245483 [Collybiopsis luxurians FD-317 M1]|uniref:Uncharacterized protein n=1 Tax=Collybiopsis luxurians FD-317 M1 TaxID=944289 RepID=A0A0D0B6L8_9AGAR|nr:hypothetical protein GYMLUDRAFT_245483 [Collybiopsis luxurians FD-317 M1]
MSKDNPSENNYPIEITGNHATWPSANISAILTIGDDYSPVAHSVHAVIGWIEQDVVECLVCADNTGQIKDRSTTAGEGKDPQQVKFQRLVKWKNSQRSGVPIVGPNYWRNGTNPLKRVQPKRIYFKAALARYFSNPLISSRAFRKLGWRIEEFLTRLLRIPFLIFKEAIDGRDVNASKIHQQHFSGAELLLMKDCGFPFLETFPIESITEDQRLQCDLQCIVKLKPVFKFILTLPGVEKALLDAGWESQLLKTLNFLLPSSRIPLPNPRVLLPSLRIFFPTRESFSPTQNSSSKPEHASLELKEDDQSPEQIAMAAEGSREGKNTDSDQRTQDEDEKDDLTSHSVLDPTVPNVILIELRSALLGVISSVIGGHSESRQSSGASSDLDLEVSNGNVRKVYGIVDRNRKILSL